MKRGLGPSSENFTLRRKIEINPSRIEPLVYLFDARKSARAQRSKTDSKQGGIDEKANVVGRSREGRDSRSYRLTIIIEESWLPKWEGRAVLEGCSEQIRPAEIRVALSWKELRACCACCPSIESKDLCYRNGELAVSRRNRSHPIFTRAFSNFA